MKIIAPYIEEMSKYIDINNFLIEDQDKLIEAGNVRTFGNRLRNPFKDLLNAGYFGTGLNDVVINEIFELIDVDKEDSKIVIIYQEIEKDFRKFKIKNDGKYRLNIKTVDDFNSLIEEYKKKLNRIMEIGGVVKKWT